MVKRMLKNKKGQGLVEYALLIAGAVARPAWRREANNVNVTVIVDSSDSVSQPRSGPDGKPITVGQLAEQFIAEAADTARPGARRRLRGRW